MRSWLRRYEIRPRKHWGQSFLVDENIPERMLAGWDLKPEIGVFEIGAGAGALTLPLLRAGQTVVAVERDRRLCELLHERIAAEDPGGRLALWDRDVLKLDPRDAIDGVVGVKGWILVGNLPYAITTPIFEWSIRHMGWFAWASIMIQKEVGERLLAPLGTGAYGSLTLWLGYHYRIERELTVKSSSFWPMPKVDSVVVRLTPWETPPVQVPSAALLEKVVRAAFSHRRKVVGGSLSRGLRAARATVEDLLAEAGIDNRKRPQECSLEEYATLTRLWAAKSAKGEDG